MFDTETEQRWRREAQDLAERQQRAAAAWAEQERQKRDARESAEREETRSTLDRRRREEEYWGSLQRTWAATRDELRDRVAALRRSIMDAESRVTSDDMAEAVAAHAELGVHEKRLADAERSYAQHLAAAPRRYA